jgi:hypothetical protein
MKLFKKAYAKFKRLAWKQPAGFAIFPTTGLAGVPTPKLLRKIKRFKMELK